MSRPPIVGIDLGTTYSLVAVLRDGAPACLPNAIGELLTPSAVSVAADGSILVGAAARARATTHPDRTALTFKRDMGTDRVHALGDQKMTPQQLSALVLASLKKDAEVALGVGIEEAVITVPAYFGDLQRQATRAAGEIAGLKVERIINEPTAAALAYGLHQRDRELRAVVLDLGGGTFDVTVLQIMEGVIEIQSSAGDARLGGEDFDIALAERIAARIQKARGVDVRQAPLAWARLRAAAEMAKKRLSEAEQTQVVLPDLTVEGKVMQVEEPITRAEAEDAWAELIERVRAPALRALRDAGLAASQVDEVLLVGGSTRMPCVSHLAAQLFGRLPLRKLPPDEAVAHGAAVQAALKEGRSEVDDMVVTDVAPFSLGISTGDRFGQQVVSDVFSPILERGTVIPASRVSTFRTMRDNQQEVEIEVFQGEHSQCSRNQHLGTYLLKNLPPAPEGKIPIDVRFTYDQNGILEIDIDLEGTGRKESFVILQRPGMMAEAEIAAARKAMAGLKLHPREALPNTTLLARADALHVELTGEARAHLAGLLVRFRAALEAQDPATIEEARQALAGLIEHYRRV
ncbi:MAG TPA: Hsp70 family protein [Myxococcaceae bacterium]|jgi:molecular chaperone HscC